MKEVTMDVDCITEDCDHHDGACTMPFIEIVQGQCASYESKP